MSAEISKNELENQAFPELAAALRSRVTRIVRAWADEIRQIIPPLRELSYDEVIDHLPVILPQIAAVMEAENQEQTRRLMDYSPAQGMARFHQRYNIRELFQEDRLLRRMIQEQVADDLGRAMTSPEGVALNTAVDLMLQQSVITYVDEQQGRLRAANEMELKHLSFLSHDLRNNLNTVTLSLQLLREQLAVSPEFAEDVEVLDEAQRAILDTVGGMGRLLEAERTRQKKSDVRRRPVDLQKLAEGVSRRHEAEARGKGIELSVEVPGDLAVESDAELLTLVLQNLMGNAVKFSTGGAVRVTAGRRDEGGCELSVADEGPGIEAEHLERIFEAFGRGETHEQDGVGLGLSIASRAAKLLGGTLSVESTVGVGSTFTLRLPGKAS